MNNLSVKSRVDALIQNPTTPASQQELRLLAKQFLEAGSPQSTPEVSREVIHELMLKRFAFFPQDVDIVVGERKIACSRVVLAYRSPYFNRLFRSAGCEGELIRQNYPSEADQARPAIAVGEVDPSIFEIWLKTLQAPTIDFSSLPPTHYRPFVQFAERAETTEILTKPNNLLAMPLQLKVDIACLQLDQLSKDVLEEVKAGRTRVKALKALPQDIIRQAAAAILSDRLLYNS